MQGSFGSARPSIARTSCSGALQSGRGRVFFRWETMKGSPSVIQYGTRHGLLLRFWEPDQAPGFQSLVGYELSKAEVRVGEHRAMSHCQIYVVAASGFLAFLGGAKNSVPYCGAQPRLIKRFGFSLPKRSRSGWGEIVSWALSPTSLASSVTSFECPEANYD